MARIRTIKPEIWGDEKLSVLPVVDRLVFVALISLADDAGRLLDNVKWLDGVLFSNTNDTSGPSLESLANIGRIVRGITPSGQRVIQIVNWSKHQKVDHPNHKACLPEILTSQSVTPIRDSLANESRPTRATTYDQRPVPTTDDQGDNGRLPEAVWVAGLPYFRAPETRLARIGEVQMLLEGMRGVRVSPEAVARGLADMLASNVKFTPVAVKRWSERAVGLLNGEAGAKAAQETPSAVRSVLGQPDANGSGSGGFAEDELE